MFSFLSLQRLSSSALTIWHALSAVKHWLDNNEFLSRVRRIQNLERVANRREAAEEEAVRWCEAAVDPQIIAFRASLNTGVRLW